MDEFGWILLGSLSPFHETSSVSNLNFVPTPEMSLSNIYPLCLPCHCLRCDQIPFRLGFQIAHSALPGSWRAANPRASFCSGFHSLFYAFLNSAGFTPLRGQIQAHVCTVGSVFVIMPFSPVSINTPAPCILFLLQC